MENPSSEAQVQHVAEKTHKGFQGHWILHGIQSFNW